MDKFMRKKLILALFILSCSFGFAKNRELRVVEVPSSPESNTIVLRLIFPRPFENKRKNPVNVQMRVEGFPLGTMTQNDRANQIFNDPDGQSIHVVIDNEPYLAFHQAVEDSFDENRVLRFHSISSQVNTSSVPFPLVLMGKA